MHDEINLDEAEYVHMPKIEIPPKVKFYLHSKTFWLNFIGLVVEILSAQPFIELPIPFLQAPATGKIIAFVVFILNIVLRWGTNSALSFRRSP